MRRDFDAAVRPVAAPDEGDGAVVGDVEDPAQAGRLGAEAGGTEPGDTQPGDERSATT